MKVRDRAPLRLQLAALLRSRWRVLGAVTLLFAAVGGAAGGLVVERTCRASALLQWHTQGRVDPVVRQAVLASVTQPSDLVQLGLRARLAIADDALPKLVTVRASADDQLTIAGTWSSAQGAAD